VHVITIFAYFFYIPLFYHSLGRLLTTLDLHAQILV